MGRGGEKKKKGKSLVCLPGYPSVGNSLRWVGKRVRTKGGGGEKIPLTSFFVLVPGRVLVGDGKEGGEKGGGKKKLGFPLCSKFCEGDAGREGGAGGGGEGGGEKSFSGTEGRRRKKLLPSYLRTGKAGGKGKKKKLLVGTEGKRGGEKKGGLLSGPPCVVRGRPGEEGGGRGGGEKKKKKGGVVAFVPFYNPPRIRWGGEKKLMLFSSLFLPFPLHPLPLGERKNK